MKYEILSFIFYIAFVIGFILLVADSSNLLVLLLIKLLGFTLMVSSGFILGQNRKD